MAKIILLALCVLFSSVVMAEQSREECWLDNMPGTKNDVVAGQILVNCNKYNPYPYAKKTDGWFGGKTTNWCIRKYGKDTLSPLAANAIGSACFRLYENK